MSAKQMVVSAALAALGTVVVGCADPPTAPSAVSGVQPAGNAGSEARSGFGNSPYQLTKAGWLCANVPHHGVHCEDPHWDQHGVHIQVKVFDSADPTSKDATFLGTESLIRAEHYKGQPCLPGHGEYFLLTVGPRAGYYICHHFDF